MVHGEVCLVDVCKLVHVISAPHCFCSWTIVCQHGPCKAHCDATILDGVPSPSSSPVRGQHTPPGVASCSGTAETATKLLAAQVVHSELQASAETELLRANIPAYSLCVQQATLESVLAAGSHFHATLHTPTHQCTAVVDNSGSEHCKTAPCLCSVTVWFSLTHSS